MKRIRFIYGAMLLVLALAMNACDDYYSVAVAGDPGVTPVVLTTPEELSLIHISEPTRPY